MSNVLIFNRGGASKLKDQVVNAVPESGIRMASALYNMFNDLHSMEYYSDINIEKILLNQRMQEVNNIVKPHVPTEYDGMVYFSPSGASKCCRELYYKALKSEKDPQPFYPYQKRWTRNASAVHEAVQRDLLYAEKVLPEAPFRVARTEEGLPKWEENIKTFKVIEHNGAKFGLYGMSDGILINTETGKEVGFEFKTKSTTIGAVGNYKMKDASESHKLQCTAYAILFGIYDHIIMYESLAKDGWNKGTEAKVDFRTFYHQVKDEDVKGLLDKYAYVTKCVETLDPPPKELDKCMFCPYKGICLGQAQERVEEAVA